VSWLVVEFLKDNESIPVCLFVNPYTGIFILDRRG